MSLEAAPQQRGNLAVLWDVIVAPAAAFAALRERPRWLLAFGVTILLGTIGAYLQIPAGEHLAAATFAREAAHNPDMATMSPEKLKGMTEMVVGIQRWAWLFYPLIVLVAVSIAALALLAGTAIARGQANFARSFALAAHVALINYGVSYLIIGFLSTLRGPDDFNFQSDLIKLVPSLAWFAPSADPKLTVLLGTFNPFQIWSFVLLGLGLQTVSGLRTGAAYAVAAVVSFGGALFAVPFAK